MNPSKIAPPLAGHTLGSTDSDFIIAEWHDPGGHTDQPHLIAPLHLHHNDDEAWYVLEGTLCVRLGEEVVELPAGSGVQVPRGIPHTYWNPGATPTRYLLIMTSNIFALIQAIHAMSERSTPALKALFQKHDSELLDS